MQMEQQKEYWRDRFSQMEKAQNASSEKKVKEIQEQFDRSLSELDKKITIWYQRLADNNGVSMKDARSLLDTDELREFRWSVEEYIKYGRENAKNQKWEKELENASAKVHIRQLEALKYEVMGEAERLYGKYADMAGNHIKDIYTDGYYRTAYEIQKKRGIGSNIRSLDKSVLEKLVSKPWAIDGRNFSERIWQDKTKLINTVYQSLTKMCITGSSAETAVAEVAKAMKVSKSQARRLVMTEAAAFSNQARQESMSNLGVKEYEVLETLDSHTCGLCGAMDKKHYRMEDFEIGVTAPPFHPQCRGGTCPYFNDEYTIGEERAARGEDGKTYYVPADMTYKEWKEAFVDSDKSAVKKLIFDDTLNIMDITDEWTKSKGKKGVVVEKQDYIVNGVLYKVDGKHVVLCPTVKEMEIADILKNKYGKNVELVPQVMFPQGIQTPDYLVDGERFDLKSPIGRGKNLLYGLIAKKRKQSHNFIIDVTDCPLKLEDLEKQAKDLYRSPRLGFLEKIVFIKDGKVEKVIFRK